MTALTGLVLAGCSSSDGDASGSGASADPKEFSVLVSTENTQTGQIFDILKDDQCSDAEAALPYKLDQTPSADLQSRISLLAGQDALPVFYAGTQSLVKPGGDLEQAGQVLDLKETLTDLGVWDQVTPAAESVIEQLYDGTIPTLPLQLNAEGIFYNKKIFADNGIEVPTTLDELKAAADELKAARVTPIVASGGTGWTISRWVGATIYAMVGSDALAKVASGDAKLTDPEYVAAAQWVQDLGPDFIEGITNLDYDTMNAQMLNGDAAMMYMGSWFLANVNDPAQNKVGEDIGFFTFPEIDGIPTNVGSPNVINKKAYNDEVGSWLTCIAENWGAQALEVQGSFSGFKVNGDVENVPPLTQEIGDIIESAPSSVLWMEGLFTPQANADSSGNAAPLLTGAMSAEDYMAQIQASLDAGR
ncbi:ABC transporter substrate-binding protein [Microbacterium tumbae]